MQLKLGEMLHRFRVEKNIEAQNLCVGLCSESVMSMIENGKRVPDVLLFEKLVERMGISPENFSIMVTEEEYEYLKWREAVCDAIENLELDTLHGLLESPIARKTYCNEILEKQFYSYASAVANGLAGDYQKALSLLRIAAEQTIPDVGKVLESDTFLCVMELHILMLYLYYGMKAKILKPEEGKGLFDALEKYIHKGKLDLEEQAECYPKLICIGMNVLSSSYSDREQMELYKKAIDKLKETMTFWDITELLHGYIPLLKKRKSRESGFYEKQYEVFCDLLQSEGFDIGFHPECLNRSKPKIYIMNEYFSSKRQELNLTQEEVCDGICAPETYSRIEKGKRTPSRKNVEAITDRLDIGWCFYRGELDTCDYKAYEIRTKQRIANIEGRYYDCLDLLDDLEACLDMNSVANYQYIVLCRTMVKYRLGLLGKTEACVILKTLFNMKSTYNDNAYLLFYSQTELEIIAYWAQILREDEKYEEGIQLCEYVIQSVLKSKIKIEQQWNGYSFVYRVLSCLYFANGEYETSIKLSEYVKREDIKRRDASNLPIRLDNIADSLEHIGKQYSKEYMKLYRYSYYLADFYEMERVLDIAKKFYEEHFDKNMVWYESYFLPVFST